MILFEVRGIGSIQWFTTALTSQAYLAKAESATVTASETETERSASTYRAPRRPSVCVPVDEGPEKWRDKSVVDARAWPVASRWCNAAMRTGDGAYPTRPSETYKGSTSLLNRCAGLPFGSLTLVLYLHAYLCHPSCCLRRDACPMEHRG